MASGERAADCTSPAVGLLRRGARPCRGQLSPEQRGQGVSEPAQGELRGGGRGHTGGEGAVPWLWGEFPGAGPAWGALHLHGEGAPWGGGGGLGTHRAAAEMSGEVHCEGCSCRSAGEPLPLAALPHPYSWIFMSLRLQMAQLGAQLWPPTLSCGHRPSPTPTRGPRPRAASRSAAPLAGPCPALAPAAPERGLSQELSPAALPCSGHPLLEPCQEPAPGLPSEGARGWGSRWSQGSVLAPRWGLLVLRVPTLPRGDAAAAPKLAAVQSQAEIIFSGVDQLHKAVGKTVTQRQGGGSRELSSAAPPLQGHWEPRGQHAEGSFSAEPGGARAPLPCLRLAQPPA